MASKPSYKVADERIIESLEKLSLEKSLNKDFLKRIPPVFIQFHLLMQEYEKGETESNGKDCEEQIARLLNLTPIKAEKVYDPFADSLGPWEIDSSEEESDL